MERRSDADLLESTENSNKTDYYSIISKEDIRKSKIGTETGTSSLNFVRTGRKLQQQQQFLLIVLLMTLIIFFSATIVHAGGKGCGR